MAVRRTRATKTTDKKRAYATQYWNNQSDAWRLWVAARNRCKKSGIMFTITVDDIPPTPKFCPITGLELRRSEGGYAQDYSPSLDRVDNAKGYIPGNVQVISYRANTCKRDMTIDEIEKLYEYIQTYKRD